MSLTTVLSVSVRPERMSTYEALVHRMADRALKQKEAFEWAAYQVVVGPLGTIHFVSEVNDWAAFAAREPVELLIRRLMGETEGAQLLDQIGQCVLSEAFVIGRERSELSYPPSTPAPHVATGMVTLLHVRPGGEEACEELIRKTAQAIPKVDDPRRFVAHQAIVGDPRTYWIVTPLSDVAALDRMLAPYDLLVKAFGPEGVLIYRTGFDAIDRIERQMTMLRPELSNAAWLGTVIGLPRQRGAAAEAAH
jgi:hypothetical protein